MTVNLVIKDKMIVNFLFCISRNLKWLHGVALYEYFHKLLMKKK